MRRLLRSVINVEVSTPENPAKLPTVEMAKLSDNLILLSKWKLQTGRIASQKILDFVTAHHYAHSQAPSLEYVVTQFKEEDPDIGDFAANLVDVEPLTGSNFEAHVRNVFKRQQKVLALEVFRDAQNMLGGKVEIETDNGKKIWKEGLQDAISHVYDKMSQLTMAESGVKLAGDFVVDAEMVIKDYELAKADPLHGLGRLTGIKEIDRHTRGVKRGEVWTHCASTGHLKTTFALNWAWRTAIMNRYNVIYITLEMKVEPLYRRLFALHSAHPKFALQGYRPLNYTQLRDGKLDEHQELFIQACAKDLLIGAARGEYGYIWVENPIDATTIADIQRLCEAKHRDSPVGLIIIDRADLVESRFPTANMTTSQNFVYKDAHAMCLNFNRGEGVPVVLLAQMNREGLEFANTNDGSYTVKHIAWANEAERSSDVITWSYLYPRGIHTDEEEAAKAANRDRNLHLNDWIGGCLKNRDNPIFNRFTGHVDWDTRLMSSATPMKLKNESMSSLVTAKYLTL